MLGTSNRGGVPFAPSSSVSMSSKKSLGMSVRGTRQPSALEVTVVRATGLRAADSNGKSDPYVMVDLRSVREGSARSFKEGSIIPKSPRTDIQYKTLNPQWDKSFDIPLPHGLFADLRLCFTVMDNDMFNGDDFLGYAEHALTLDTLACTIAKRETLTFDLKPREGSNAEMALYFKSGKNFGQLEVRIRGTAEHNWSKQIGAESNLSLRGVSVALKEGRGLRFAEKKNTRPVVRIGASTKDGLIVGSQPQSEKNPVWGDVFDFPLPDDMDSKPLDLTFLLTSKDQRKFVGYKKLQIDKKHLLASVGREVVKEFPLGPRPDNDQDQADFYSCEQRIGLMTVVYRAWGVLTPKTPVTESEPEPVQEAPVQEEPEPQAVLLGLPTERFNDIPSIAVSEHPVGSVLEAVDNEILGSSRASSEAQPLVPKGSLKSRATTSPAASMSASSSSSDGWSPVANAPVTPRRTPPRSAAGLRYPVSTPQRMPKVSQCEYPSRRKRTPPQMRRPPSSSGMRRGDPVSKRLTEQLAEEFSHLTKAIKEQNDTQNALLSLVAGSMSPQRAPRTPERVESRSTAQTTLTATHKTIHIDRGSGLYYTHDPATGRSEWLTQEPPSPTISSGNSSGASLSSACRSVPYSGGLTAEALSQLV